MSFITLLSLVSLVSLFNTDIEGSVNRVAEPITISVFFYNTPQQVTEKYKEIEGISRIRRVSLRDGFAVWTEWRGGDKPVDELYTCEIHTLKPRRIDGPRTTLLGHELLHCIIGTYH